ncbi:MAG: glycosyltransferase [Actinobacteria bacterium]|nr:glycosyltransferase [Actinomycetota bacterium]
MRLLLPATRENTNAARRARGTLRVFALLLLIGTGIAYTIGSAVLGAIPQPQPDDRRDDDTGPGEHDPADEHDGHAGDAAHDRRGADSNVELSPYPPLPGGEAPAEPGVDDQPVHLAEGPSALSPTQVAVAVVLLAGLAIGLTFATLATAVIANTAVVTFFCASNVMKLVLTNRGLRDNSAITVSRRELATLADQDLPLYTILLPVFHEASILRQLVDGVEALEYPQHLLDVKLLLEVDDDETRRAAEDMALPPCFDVVVVPDVGPRGKPRACNVGLARAKGELLVIYDAEDRPEPDQLRKSVCAFRRVDPRVVCLQAKLNYFNRSHNLLTRWFTAEYSVWFDQLLPGLQSSDVAIPLGGTSNHFRTESLRELGGWDAYNVTEDADLGLRIYVEGWKTAVLDTTTYEEATSRYRNWIRQRSRWVKGYMQTWLFHMRHPVRLARAMGPRAFIVFQLFFGACTICLLVNPIYWALTGLWFATHMGWIQSVFPRPLLYAGTIALFVGNGACVLLALSGAFGRRNYGDVKWALLVPFYWLLMSVAAYKALSQLFYKPSYWEKTEHGHCRYDDEDVRPLGFDAPGPVLAAAE